MDPKKRLVQLQQANPSIRVAAAPSTPQISISQPRATQGPTISTQQPTNGGGNVYLPGASAPVQAHPIYTPAAPVSKPSIGGFLKGAGNMLISGFKPLGQGVARLFPGGQNDLAANQKAAQSQGQIFDTYNTLYKQGKITKEKYAQLVGNASQDSTNVANEAQRIADTADKSQVVGSALLTAAAPLAGGANGFATSLGGKVALGAGEGAVGGALNDLAVEKDPTLRGMATNVGIGTVTGGALPIVGAGFNKFVKTPIQNARGTNPAAVGLDKTAINYLKSENNVDSIHAFLVNHTGEDTQAVLDAAKQIATSKSSKAIIRTIGEIGHYAPEEAVAGAATKAVADNIAAQKLAKKQAQEQADNNGLEYKNPLGVQQGEGSGSINIKNDAIHEPFTTSGGVKAQIDPETAPYVKGKISQVKAKELSLGGGTYGETDPAQVAKYIQDITDGKPIEPVIVNRDANGKLLVEDGKHRIAALQALGKEDIPVVEQAAKSAGSDKAVAPAPEKPLSGTTSEAPQGDLQTTTSPSADPAVDSAKKDVIDSLGNAQAAYDEAAAVRSGEKGQRAASASSAFDAAGGGTEGVAAKLKALKGEYTKSTFTIDIPKEKMGVLHNAIEANPELRPFEKTNAQVALMKLNGDIAGGPTPYDIGILRKAFGNDFADAVGEAVANSQTTKDKVLSTAGQVVGLPKSIMASYDLSGTLRQGGILASRFPKQAVQAFKDELRYFGSEDAFKQGMQEIANRPTFDSMMKAKLAVTGTDALDKSEEQFVSNLAEKIPGFGVGVRASDRAYTGFLTKLRADVFDSIVKRYADEGMQLSDKELQDIGKFINTASGRGDLGKYLEQHSATLSTALFSPRLWKSRLDTLNPAYYYKLSGPARKYALQSAASFAAEASTVLGLAALAGAQVETDMRSSDFGKIKIGNTRYDILGGLQQNIVFAWREISGQKKNSETGAITDLTAGKFGSADRLSTLTDMIQNKENPALSAGQRIIQGHDRGGNKVNPIEELAKLAVPLPISGIAQAANDIGTVKSPKDLAKGLAIASPDFIGISSQTYGSTPTKNKGKPDATGVPTFKGKVEPNMVTDANGKVMTNDKGQPVTVNFKGNETQAEKDAMIAKAQKAAYKDKAVRLLNKSDAEIYKIGTADKAKLSPEQATTFDRLKKWVSSYGQASKTPAGADSELAKQVYEKYNSMDSKDQKYWLSDKNPPDASSQRITALLNEQRSPGLSEFKPSNALAKMYADYEKDLNTHDYSEVDKRNKAKSFQVAAAQMQVTPDAKSIYKEGGSSDLKTLIGSNKIDKASLDAAVKLDEELYNSGLTGTLKFSKKFRSTYGYNLPTGGGINANTASGSSSANNAHLSSYIPRNSSSSGTSGVPTFSKKSRKTPGLTAGVTTPKASPAPKVNIKL